MFFVYSRKANDYIFHKVFTGVNYLRGAFPRTNFLFGKGFFLWNFEDFPDCSHFK